MEDGDGRVRESDLYFICGVVLSTELEDVERDDRREGI